MPRFKVSLLAACGLLILAAVLGAIGPKRALAALGYTPVRDVDNVGRQPFAAQIELTSNQTKTFSVAANKRLVISAVTAFTFGTADTFANIGTTVDGASSPHFVPYTTRGSFSFANVAGEALAHADPGTTVVVTHTGSDTALITIVGYYVDVP